MKRTKLCQGHPSTSVDRPPKQQDDEVEAELDEKKPYILQLPYHMLVEIFCKIPMETLIQCKCVCKSWLRWLSDSQFTKHLFSRTPTSLLLLDFSPGYNSRRIFLVDLDEALLGRTDVLLELPEDPNHGIDFVGSCNGLLCLYNHDLHCTCHSFYISNPITCESLALPTLATEKILFYSGFGFSPISDIYKVVLIRYPRGEVMVMTVGSGIWRCVGDSVYSFGYHTHLSPNGIYVNGFLHWIAQCSKGSFLICAFDLETERFQELPLPPCSLDWKSPNFHLGVLKGWLSITARSSNNIDVWVMKDYGVNGCWTKELEIEDIVDSEVLMFTEKGQVLLRRPEFHAYDPKRKNCMRLHIDGLPFLTGVLAHIPSFVSLKDAIRG